MNNLEKSKTEYLVELEQDIADELDIASGNSYDLATSAFFGELKRSYFDKESFDEFAKRISALANDIEDANLFTPANSLTVESDEFGYEYALDMRRLNTLIEVSQNILINIDLIRKTDAYKKLQIMIPDKDVTLLALLVEEMKMYAEDMLEVLDRNKQFLLADFQPVIKKMKVLAKRIIDSKSRSEVVEMAYQMEEILADYFETLIDRTFEWDAEQINRANWFVNTITEFEANWYFLLLLREEQVIKLGLQDNANVNPKTDFYQAKQELLNEGNVLLEAGIAYNGKQSKKSNK